MAQPVLFAKSPIGVFVFDHKGELFYFRFFSKNSQKAAAEYLKTSINDVKHLKQGVDVVENDEAYIMLRQNFRDYAKSLGFAENDAELNRFLSDFGHTLSKESLVGRITKDRFVIQAANALDDINRASNVLQERLYEWFSLHYPEIKNKDLAGRVASHRRRENFPDFSDSRGVEINEKDEDAVAEFAKFIIDLNAEKSRLEEYVKSSMTEVAPNVSSLMDPLLAARLLAQAGSLEKLARMPASTIQLLGAEKALFRHLHKKGRSPKYGIIFTAAAVQNAPPENKGKMARLLASKLMMAARIDYYSGRYEARLKQELDAEMGRVS